MDLCGGATVDAEGVGLEVVGYELCASYPPTIQSIHVHVGLLATDLLSLPLP